MDNDCEPATDDGADDPCDDGVACTRDGCAGAACWSVPDEGSCGAGEICNPCEYGDGTGCGARPETARVECESSGVVDAPVACTLLLDGISCEAPRVSCTADLQQTVLLEDTFDADPPDASVWTTVSGTPAVSTLPSGESAAFAENAFWTMETRVDARDFDVLCLDFDFAADNAGAGERIEIEFSTNNGDSFQLATLLDFDSTAPSFWGRDEHLSIWFGNICLEELDPAAAGNADLRLRVDLTSDEIGDRVYLDNFRVLGFRATTTTVFCSEFDLDPGLDPAWTEISGDAHVTTELLSGGSDDFCSGGFGGGSAAVADDNLPGPGSWSVETTSIDASPCEVIDLSFDIAHDNERTGESLSVEVSSDGGVSWASVISIDFGTWRDDNVLSDLGLMRVTEVDPAAANNDDLRFRVSLSSNAGNDEVYIDNFAVLCHDLTDASTSVTTSALVDNTDGSYDFNVVSSVRGSASVTCAWNDGDEEPLRASSATVEFRHPL